MDGNRIRISKTQSDEFTLEVLSEDAVPRISSQWRPDWSFRNRSLGLSGVVQYQQIELNVRLGIPIEFSTKPLQNLLVELSSQKQPIETSLTMNVNRDNQAWLGKGDLKIKHPEWGEFFPGLKFNWGDKQELVLSVKPEQIRSKLIQIERDVDLKVERDKEVVKGNLEIAGLTLNSNWEFKKGKINIEQVPNKKEIRFFGSLASFSSLSPPYKNLKEVFAKGKFNGLVQFGEKSKHRVSIKGELNDNLQSIRVPFQLQGNREQLTKTAQFNIDLFEGSLLDLILKEHMKDAKLLTGQIRGELKDQKVKWGIEPTTLLFGDYLFSNIQGQGNADTQKNTITVQSVDFNFADGQIKVEPFELLLGADETPLNFKANDLQIKKILSSAARGKITGKGLFRGRGRFMFSPHGSYLSALNLENSTPGIISYLDPSQPYFEKKIVYLDQFQDLLAQGQQALVLKALENFHYTRVQLQADRPSSDRMKVLLNLKGKNPDLAKGQLFDITLPIEGDIDSLVKGSVFQQPLTDELHKRHIETE